ncbi:methyltransferase domain-containing protein [Bosea sp. 117]|uniref:class I SAM-dependent DNA methyltransferase n=1 Tax=Bosea sp. 117 TaxID=1125973 RepID=UPI000494B9FF|nr:methyltransferase domain-containing protein [Bosea sp. 117]
MSTGPLHLSSGDPAIDRRLEWARALLDEGNAADAVELLAEAVKRAPQFLSGWFLLGEAREAMDDRAGAAAAYERALALDGEDRLGAGARLARLGQQTGIGGRAGLGAGYVRTLFDQYAARFDDALARLGYRGPELVAGALEAVCAAQGRPFHFEAGLDLGCGTGLVGVALASQVERLEGVDLSPNMVALAQARGVYAALEAGDMVDFLRAREGGVADLVVAGDAFCYLDALDPILTESHRVLRAGGLVAFTVETHGGEGVILRDTLRYAHGEAYVREALAEAGLALRLCEAQSTRMEKNAPVPGLIVVAEKS